MMREAGEQEPEAMQLQTELSVTLMFLVFVVSEEICTGAHRPPCVKDG